MIDLKRLVLSFHYAFEGIAHAFFNDQNIRIHTFIAVVVILAGIFFHVSSMEMIILVMMISIIFAAELANTAIEEMVDFIVKEHHPEAKIIKDVAAGMVFAAATGAVIVGLYIFIPHIIRFLTY